MQKLASSAVGSGKRRAAIKRELTAWSFVLPSLIGLGIFVYGSLAYSLYVSFTSWDLLTPPRWVGIANFVRAFRDEAFIQCMGNTLYFVVAIVPVGIVLAMAMAIALNRQLPGFTFFRAAYYMPSITSTVAIGLVWLWIFNPDQGVLNSLLRLLGAKNPPRWLESMVWAKPALSMMRIWQVSGYYMLMYLTGLQNIPKDLYEAAEIDGATRWQQIRHITVPLLTNTTVFATIMLTIEAFNLFEAIYVMTTGRPGGTTNTILYYIYTQAFQNYRMGYASAMAWILFALLFVVTIAQFLAQRKKQEVGY